MINKFLEILKNSNSVAILTHTNPDGDAFGSSMMLWDLLENNFPNIKKAIFTEFDKLSDEFVSMTKNATLNPNEHQYDVAIAVDCGDLNRFAKYSDVFYNANHTVCFDHHKGNPNYSELNFNNILSSNCENLFNYLYPLNMKLSTNFYKYCYVGILTDTNNLTTPLVSANTYEIVAKIIKAGVNIRAIYSMFFQGNTKNRYKLLGKSIAKAEYWFDGKVIFINITQEDLTKCQVSEDDTSVIINQAFALYKNGYACFVASPRKNKLHISMRCVNGMDISHIARMFGGGGHACASACDTIQHLEEAKIILQNEIKKEIDMFTQKDEKPF